MARKSKFGKENLGISSQIIKRTALLHLLALAFRGIGTGITLKFICYRPLRLLSHSVKRRREGGGNDWCGGFDIGKYRQNQSKVLRQ